MVQLSSKMDPSRSQKSLKINDSTMFLRLLLFFNMMVKICSKMCHKAPTWANMCPKGAQDEPKMSPKWAKMGNMSPKWATKWAQNWNKQKNISKCSQDAPKCSQNAPKLAQNEPKMSPRCSQVGPRCPQVGPRCFQEGLKFQVDPQCHENAAK